MKNFRSLAITLTILAGFFFVIQAINIPSIRGNGEIFFSDFINMSKSSQISEISIQSDQIVGTTTDGVKFVTIPPVDLDYVALLQDYVPRIKVLEDESTPLLIQLFIQWGPILFLIGFWIFMLKRSSGAAGGSGNKSIFSITKSRSKRHDPEKIPFKFADVAGIDEAKADLYEIIDYLRDHKRFRDLGGKIPRGILMVGPPGNGKTLLAKALAGEANVPFFSISGSDFVEMVVGVGAGRVRALFEDARAAAPAIIFIDEIDAVGRHRGAGLGSGHDEREQTLNQLLVEMDGFDTQAGIIVIAATNRSDILDPALMRPGRFDRQVFVNLPDIKGRKAILEVYAKKVKVEEDINLDVIARGTPGFSGAELESLVNEAALWAARNGRKKTCHLDLEWARDKVMMGAERKSMILSEEDRRLTAYHESGHALVSSLVSISDPIHKITIIPRGRAMGVTAFLPENDKLTFNRQELTDKLCIMMGGRAAEEIVLKDITTGAEGDIKHATETAYRMLGQWGMSNSLGAFVVHRDHGGSFLPLDYHNRKTTSEEMLWSLDQEVSELLKQSYEKAKQLISDNIDNLHKIAEALLEKETLTSEQFHEIIQGNHAV